MTAPPPNQVLLSWSGGKDAAWALHVLRQRGDVDVVGLLTTIVEGADRVSMQDIRVEVVHAQAASAGLPLIEMRVPRQPDNAVYGARLAEALQVARSRWPSLRTLAFGDLFLDDIRHWRMQQCARLGWEAAFPLFGRDTAALAREMQAGGLRAALCCVDTTQLDASFAGSDFDADLLAALPVQVDPCGERGEFHTCVLDGPMFAAPLMLARGPTVLREGRFACTDFLART
ncbi:ATP-binding protein [Luteimonas chenhongjianii]|uniref:ATP-binding protein n=1 Tax=Luteimonas chenhongjianii TaxID=2006110 RepID=A0A290XCF2_9GAMM|nr:ATP-binding protein [Luteimonas chenhongjianii]ATD66668.1 ATP-binding protein [Luteimonas chenhongjianii]